MTVTCKDNWQHLISGGELEAEFQIGEHPLGLVACHSVWILWIPLLPGLQGSVRGWLVNGFTCGLRCSPRPRCFAIAEIWDTDMRWYEYESKPILPYSDHPFTSYFDLFWCSPGVEASFICKLPGWQVGDGWWLMIDASGQVPMLQCKRTCDLDWFCWPSTRFRWSLASAATKPGTQRLCLTQDHKGMSQGSPCDEDFISRPGLVVLSWFVMFFPPFMPSP